MQFDFHSTRSILVERGGSTQLAKIAQEQGASKVLIVTDPGVLSAGLLEMALPQFKELHIPVHVFSDVQADPPVVVIEKAVQVAQEYRTDCVIGFGGGAALDVAKVVGVAATHPGDILEYVKSGFTFPPGLVIFEDPPTHTMHRGLMSRVFTPRKVASAPKVMASL
mgnify:CR=1 FL=1